MKPKLLTSLNLGARGIASTCKCPCQSPLVLARSLIGPQFLGRSRLLRGSRLPLPFLQSLHLACLQLVQVLFLHVHTAKLGAKGIMGDVFLLLGLNGWYKEYLLTIGQYGFSIISKQGITWTMRLTYCLCNQSCTPGMSNPIVKSYYVIFPL